MIILTRSAEKILIQATILMIKHVYYYGAIPQVERNLYLQRVFGGAEPEREIVKLGKV